MLLQYAKISHMYTTPQMPHEALPATPASFPTFWSICISTLKTWKDAWGIYSIINLAIVVIGGVAWYTIVSIMPWAKMLFRPGNSFDPAIITTYYPTITDLITDLSLVCLVLIAFIIAVCISQIITIQAIKPEIRHRGLKSLFANAFHLTPKYVFTTAIIGLIVTGGMSLLLIPGFLLIPLAIMGIFVVALENKFGMAAAERSAELVKGRIIDTLWRSLLIILFVHIMSLLLPLLATMLVYPFTLLNFSAYTIRILSFIAGTIYTFISFILSLIMPSLLIIFYYHLYDHMKSNPVEDRAIHPHLLHVLAWIGLVLVLSLLLLETFGI